MTRAFGGEAFRAYARLLLQLHERWDDESAADAVRDAMDAVWDDLSPEEQIQVRGLASDLNWVRRGLAPRGPKPEEVTSADIAALVAANLRMDMSPEMLRLMRVCAPRVPAGWLAFRRAQLWNLNGYPEIALPFYKHARQLDPGNQDLGFDFLMCLSFAYPERAIARAFHVLAQPHANEDGELLAAIMVTLLFKRADLTLEQLGAMAQTTDLALRRLRQVQAEWKPGLLATASLVGCICYAALGQQSKALEFLEVGAKEGGGPGMIMIHLLLAQAQRTPEEFQHAVEEATAQVFKAA